MDCPFTYKPTVLFLYKNKNLADIFAKHFRLYGYDLYQFYDEDIPQYKLSGIQRLENIFHRLLLRNTKQIHRIHDRNFYNHTSKKLAELKGKDLKFDYCFVIRGDLIPEQVLSYARKISTKMIDYQLDGLSVSSKILDYKDCFNQIYVFDPKDLADYPEYNLKLITNCYFGEEENTGKPEIDLLYIGQYLPQRQIDLRNLHNHLKNIKQVYTSYTSLYGSNVSTDIPEILQHTQPIAYNQNIEFVKKSKVLIDFKRDEHDGLSLRFFEALQFGKKVITNNTAAIGYDFYHPDNIFITDYTAFDNLEEWLTKPYVPVDHCIKLKYRFDNWIKNILYPS